ncbi:MAG: phosphoribosylanthranilate isomerase [Fidelibacterota bacterium]
MKNYIQIAGVHDSTDADVLVTAGVDAIGFPLRLYIHNPYLSEESAKKIIHRLHSHVKPVLITYLERSEEIVNFCNYLGVHWVQLHGDTPVKEVTRLRNKTSDFFIIKSLVISNDNLTQLEKAVEEYSPYVDAFITDTYDSSTGAKGATGRTHDWDISRKLVGLSERPVILAGGLHGGNISAAIRIVRPAGVDVHTGVKDKQMRNDPHRVSQFITTARKAFNKETIS